MTRATTTAKVDTKTIDYTGYAKQYDSRRFHGRANEYFERVRLRGLERAVAGLARGARALDVGCGTGRGLCDMNALGFTSLTGLDFTHAMIAQAAEKLRAKGIGRPGLVRADGFRLPFPDGAFPVVVSFNFLHMFRFDLQRELAAEMTRVCAPGGTLILELESVHRGLVISRYLEQRRLRDRTKFNSALEVRKLFPAGRVRRTKVVGTVFPGAYRALQYMPALGEAVESIAHVPPFNWLASRVFVVGRRLEGSR